MLKESILFVASTGLLIYFIAPSDAPPADQPVKEQVQEPVKPAVQASDDGWDNEDDEDEDSEESFVFGDPMTVLDDENDSESVDEELRSARQEQADNSGARNSASASRTPKPSPNSPRSGEPGSLENPIVFKTNNPVDPVDD